MFGSYNQGVGGTCYVDLTGVMLWAQFPLLGLIPGLRPANERQRYIVTTSLIGWAQEMVDGNNNNQYTI